MRWEEGPSRALGGAASQPVGLLPEMGLGFIRTERGLWAPEILAHSGHREKQKPEREKGFASWLQPQERPGPGGRVPWAGSAPVGAPGLSVLLGAPGNALLLEVCGLILPAHRVPAEQGQRERVCTGVCGLPTAYGLEHRDPELLTARPSHRGRTGYEDSGARRPGLKQLCGGVVPHLPAPVFLWGRLSPGGSRLQQPQSGGREGRGPAVILTAGPPRLHSGHQSLRGLGGPLITCQCRLGSGAWSVPCPVASGRPGLWDFPQGHLIGGFAPAASAWLVLGALGSESWFPAQRVSLCDPGQLGHLSEPQSPLPTLRAPMSPWDPAAML